MNIIKVQMGGCVGEREKKYLDELAQAKTDAKQKDDLIAKQTNQILSITQQNILLQQQLHPSPPKPSPPPPPPPPPPSPPAQLLPFFQGFQLSPTEFEPKGDYLFPDDFAKAETQFRGGFPYFQPVLGKRYGLNVYIIYDSGSSDWLRMNKGRKEWAIAYHGIKAPLSSHNGKTVLKSIIEGRATGTMLKAGDHQQYANNPCVNYPNELVGNGIYLSPHCETSLLEYTTPAVMKGQTFHIVLVCKVKPEKVRICNGREDYWVVNQSQYVRPYGIILFTPEQVAKIKAHVQSGNEIHKRFVWSDHLQKYQTFINS